MEKRRRKNKNSSEIKSFENMQRAIDSANVWYTSLSKKTSLEKGSRLKYTTKESRYELFNEKRKILEEES